MSAKAYRPKRIFPSYLSAGDYLGVVAPASPFANADFQAGIKSLAAQGFKVHYRHDLFNRRGYLAGTDKQRAAQFTRSFCLSKIKAVIAARGGYGSMRLLEQIDWNKLADNPKLFIGYSDNTFIHAALYSRLGFTSIHGPHVCSLNEISPASIAWLYELITGAKRPPFVYRGKKLTRGSARGRLWGGNLTVICHMIGTDFLPSLDGHILFLEDIGEKPYRLDRALMHLKMSGVLKHVAGVALGQFFRCGPRAEINRLSAEIFSDLHLPVIMNLPCGHGPRNLALPLGVEAEIDADKGILTVAESGLSD